MSKGMNIYSNDWCDMVFEGKNQEYGAYLLRRFSSRRHMIALISAVSFFTLAVSSPVIIRHIMPAKKEKMVEVTSLANVKVENTKPKEENEVKAETPPPPLKSTIKFTPPEIRPDEEVTEDDLPKTQEELQQSQLSISIADVQGNDEVNGVDIATLNANKEITQEAPEEKPLVFVEQMPEFPGGETEMYKFIQSNVVYPQIARETGIEGTVYVTFVVDKSGKISKIKLLKGIGGGCDEEAIRLVKLMPEWKPGKQNGSPVPVQFNLPIKFTLK